MCVQCQIPVSLDGEFARASKEAFVPLSTTSSHSRKECWKLCIAIVRLCILYVEVEWKRNVMAHAQKLDLVFQRNGRVHLYRRGCQFSRLLAAEVCASAVVMLDRPRSHTVHECWLPTPFASFPFTSPPVLRRVPSDSVSTLLENGKSRI